MRRTAMLVGMLGLPLAASAALAQTECDDPAVSVSAAPASLAGFAVLFRQNGVTFYGRPAATEGTPVARILIRNGNRFPVEVTYSVLLEFAGDSLPRSLDLGRHCAQIPPGQYATAEDAAPAPPTVLRVRNLTIADLSAARGAAGQPPALAPAPPAIAPRGAPVAVSTGTARPVASPAGRTNAPTVRTPTAQAGEAADTPIATLPAAPDTAPVETPEPPVSDTRDPAPDRSGDGAVVAWATEATYAAFFFLSAIVMVAGGVALVLPVLAGFALLAYLAVDALRRRIARRAA